MAEEHLVVTNGSSVGARLDLDGDTFVIGRDDDTELAIDDSQASRRHARVTRSPAGLMVEDLGSTNGTFLGGSRISSPQPWGPSDELRIGRTTIALKGAPARTEIGGADQFVGTVAAAPAPPPAAAPPPPHPPPPGRRRWRFRRRRTGTRRPRRHRRRWPRDGRVARSRVSATVPTASRA